MKKTLLCICAAGLLNSCLQHPDVKKSVDYKDPATSNAHYMDKKVQEWRAFIYNINEPDLKDISKQAFRFVKGSLENKYDPVLLFTVIMDTPSRFISKLVFPKGDSFIINNKTKFTTKDSIIRQTNQTLTNCQTDSLMKLLRATYFWSISGNTIFSCNDYHGEFERYTFEARYLNYGETLTYKLIPWLYVYHESGFNALWNFLGRNSALFTKKEKHAFNSQ